MKLRRYETRMDDHKGVAFFDLDRTLLLKNSTQIFGAHFFKKGTVRKWCYIRAYFLYTLYLCGWLSLDNLIQKSTALFFSGKDHSLLSRLSEKFWEKRLREELVWNPQVLWLWKQVQSRGYKVGLLTSAPDFIARPIAQFLEADFCHCTTFHLGPQSEILSCELSVTGEQKRIFALDKIAEGSCSDGWQGSIGVGDSVDDLPFLECCDEVYLVAPSKLLLRQAEKKQKNAHFSLKQLGSNYSPY